MKTKRNGGFLLLEAMLALAILAFGFGSIMFAIHNSLRAVIASKNYSIARDLVQTRMSELRREDKIKEGETAGKFDHQEGFAWKQTSTMVEENGLYEVIVQVIWKENNREMSTGITTYIFRPKTE